MVDERRRAQSLMEGAGAAKGKDKKKAKTTKAQTGKSIIKHEILKPSRKASDQQQQDTEVDA
jgi:hypothetical protein